MSTSDRIGTSINQLDGAVYEGRASDFVRYRDEGTDGAVGSIVRAVSAEDREGCDEFRRRTNHADALETFTRRRVLQGRRQSSLAPLYEAMDGFALLPPGLVPWDSWLSAALLLAHSFGGDIQLIARRFADLASEVTTQRFDVALDAMNRVESLEQCRLVEVETTYGVGFVETMVFRAVPGGLYRAPTLGLNEIAFHPTTNLAQLSVTLADGLETTGAVSTGPIGQDQLAATSFSMTTAGSYLATEGCLSFVADLEDDSACTVFVAEFTGGSDLVELAERANSTYDQCCVVDASRLVLVSPQPNFESEDDVAVNLQIFEDLARSALATPE